MLIELVLLHLTAPELASDLVATLEADPEATGSVADLVRDAAPPGAEIVASPVLMARAGEPASFTLGRRVAAPPASGLDNRGRPVVGQERHTIDELTFEALPSAKLDALDLRVAITTTGSSGRSGPEVDLEWSGAVALPGPTRFVPLGDDHLLVIAARAGEPVRP